MFSFKALSSAIGLSVLLSCASAVQAGKHHAETKSFSSQKVADSINLLQGKGGNIAVLTGKQGILMIDADYQHMSPALKEALMAHGGHEQLTYIINTHWHGDHTQGNLEMGHHAQIIAHDNVRERLLTAQEIKLFKMVSEPYPEHALPSLTYEQAMSLHINGEQVDIVHYPGGHTDGDSVVFFKNANVVHMGDHFFNGFFPFVDVDTGGNVQRMADNVGKVLELIDDQTIVIPGHGPVADKQQLAAFQRMLVGTQAEVKGMMAQGMSLEQIQQQGLSAHWSEWADGFLSTDVWISIVYSSLKAQSM